RRSGTGTAGTGRARRGAGGAAQGNAAPARTPGGLSVTAVRGSRTAWRGDGCNTLTRPPEHPPMFDWLLRRKASPEASAPANLEDGLPKMDGGPFFIRPME